MNASKAFIAVSALGVVGAVYHAWSEQAFSTNISLVNYAPYASFYGIPYWIFGVVWFPLLFVLSLWATRMGKGPLRKELLILLTIGNIFTGYLWYLDLQVVRAYTIVYILLYATNYVLTGLVVFENRTNDVIHGFVYGTVLGALIGLFFGPFGVALGGIGGGIFGAVRNFVIPKEASHEAQPIQDRSPVVRS